MKKLLSIFLLLFSLIASAQTIKQKQVEGLSDSLALRPTIRDDTAHIIGVVKSGTVDNVDSLRATDLYSKGFTLMFTRGYATSNDGGGSRYVWNATSTATDDSKFVFRPNNISSGSAGRWEWQARGVVRASEVGVKSNGTDQTTTLNSLFSLSTVKEVLFDIGDVKITGKVDGQGKNTRFENGARIVGASGSADTLYNINVICDYQTPCFDTLLTVRGLKNRLRSAGWFDLYYNYKTDGTSVTYIDNWTALTNCFNSSVDLENSDNRYQLFTSMYIPSSPVKTYGLGIKHTLVWNAGGTVFGDGQTATKLYWPSALGAPAVEMSAPITSSSGFGGTLLQPGGQNIVFHDLALCAGGENSNIGAGGFFDNKSHGIKVTSQNVYGYNCTVQRFRGDGICVFGDVQQTPATNANNCTFVGITSIMNGGGGITFRGGDANNNGVYNCNLSKNGRWGAGGYSFLGNDFYKCHNADNAYENQWQKTNVYNSGHRYRAILPQVKYVWEAGNVYRCILNHDRTTANSDPVTGSLSSTYWSLVGAGSPNDSIADYADEGNWTFVSSAVIPAVTTGWANYWEEWGTIGSADVFDPQYDSTHWYTEGGGYLVQGGNDRSHFNGCYVEGDQHEFTNRGLATVIGGFLAEDGTADGAIGYDNVLHTIQAKGFSAKNTTNGWKAIIASRYGNYTEYPFIGFRGTYYNLGFELYNGAWVSSWADEFFGAGQGKLKFISPEYDVHSLMGRDRTPPGVKILTDEIFFNLMNSADSSRSIRFSTTMPTSGDFGKGDIVFCTDPASNVFAWQDSIPSTLGTGAMFTTIYRSGASSGSPTGTAGRIALFNQSTGALTDDSHFTWTTTKASLTADTVTASNLQISKAFDLPTTSYANSLGSGDRTATITTTTNLSLVGTWTNMINGVKQPETGTYLNGSSCVGAFMTFDFGSGQSKVITELTWYQSTGAYSHGTWKGQASDDGSTWVDISSTQTLGGSSVSTFTLSPTKGYRYYRLAGVSGNTNGNPWIEEIEFKINDASAGIAYTKVQSTGAIRMQPDSGIVEIRDSLKITNAGNTANKLVYIDPNHYIHPSTLSPDSNYTTQHVVDSARNKARDSVVALIRAITSPIQILNVQYTDASNVSTGETNLLSYTLPANTLVSDGDFVTIDAIFTTPANGNSKSMKFYFGGVTHDYTSSTIANGATITFRIIVIRTASNAQRIQISRITGYSDFPAYYTTTETDTNNIVIKFSGTGAASDDITQRTMITTYYHYAP
jgi:hypothetical protein